MTYPNETVAAALNQDFVPVQIDVQRAAEVFKHRKVIWTPNLNVLDGGENLVYYTEGWISPAEFVTMLFLARGHYHLQTKNPVDAGDVLSQAVDRHPQSEFAPEILYYLGVARYLASGKEDNLVEEWKKLQSRYPASAWAKRSAIV